MDVKIKKLRENAIIPTKGSKKAAGYDFYACCDDIVIIEPHKTVKIGTEDKSKMSKKMSQLERIQ